MSESPVSNKWHAYRLRAMIGTGLIMFVFISMHLVNLSLGLVSVQLMDDWRWALSGVWSSFPPLKIALNLSLVVHFALALVSLYLRNTLRVPAYDMAQMIAGVMIIPLMAPHVFGIMAADEIGFEPTYALVLSQFWVFSPVDGLLQIVMLVVAWIHGAIGMFTWLQSRDGSAGIMRVFYPFVVALPIVAMLGYVEAGRQIIPVEDGGMGFVLEDDPNANGPTATQEEIGVIIAQTEARIRNVTVGSLGLVLLALAARWVRVRGAWAGQVRATYVGKRSATFETASGLSLLEMAQENGLPHASVCRGRGRCGTCRVRVLSGGENLPAPSETEAKVLAHWNAEPDQRLACQIKPTSMVLEVERVIEADYSNLDYSETKRSQDTQAETA
ncbi:MAG: 2Fe-2S iron-sulfur cluster binding domain-containing protein [Rhodobacteraceae bacterium]|nr:2Fe-2S iron-sulfur cluster binding domain-containing protein [Paracoccaceae bacterium]